MPLLRPWDGTVGILTGRTLNEDSIKANARWMVKHLKRFGWEYVVVDEGWYLANLDIDGNDQRVRFEMDAYGRYLPVRARFPDYGPCGLCNLRSSGKRFVTSFFLREIYFTVSPK